MANRFCASCGAKLLSGASFCVECGEPQPGARRHAASRRPLVAALRPAVRGAGRAGRRRRRRRLRDTVAQDAADGAARTNAPARIGRARRQPCPKATRRSPSPRRSSKPSATWRPRPRPRPTTWTRGNTSPRCSTAPRNSIQTYLPQAQKSYEHVLEHEPNNLDVIHALGNIAFDMEQPDQAVDYYQRYLKEKPDDLEVQTDLGTMYLSARQDRRGAQAVRGGAEDESVVLPGAVQHGDRLPYAG